MKTESKSQANQTREAAIRAYLMTAKSSFSKSQLEALRAK